MAQADKKLTAVSEFVREVASTDRSAAFAFFLMEQGKAVTGRWTGRISADDQRALFGFVVGRGKLIVDGARELVEMVVSACYGMDFSTEFSQPWEALTTGVLSTNLAAGHIAQPYRYRHLMLADAA